MKYLLGTLICIFLYHIGFSQKTLDNERERFSSYKRSYDSLIDREYSLKSNIHTPDLHKAVADYDDVIKWENKVVTQFGQDRSAFDALEDDLRFGRVSAYAAVDRMDKLNDDMGQLLNSFSMWVITPLTQASYSDNAAQEAQRQNAETVFADRGSSLVTRHVGMNCALSLPFLGVPMYQNSEVNGIPSSQKSTELGYVGLNLSLDFHVYKNRWLDIQALGGAEYTNGQFINDLLSSSDGSSAGGGSVYYSYNYGGEIALGLRHVKVYGQYLAGYRNMNFTYTLDLSAYGGTSSTETALAAYNYSRLSAGLMVDFSDDDDERFVKAFYSLETPDYSSGQSSWGAGMFFRDYVDLSFFVFPDYMPYGTAGAHVTNPNGKVALWYASIGKAFKIF